MQALVLFTSLLLRSSLALFRSHQEQAIVELTLRQQLAAHIQKRPRPRLSPMDRAFWVALSQLWPRSRDALLIVSPETVARWHRNGFRRYWRSISKPGPGRPPSGEPTHRHLIYDNDAVFSPAVASAIKSFEVDPKRTAFRSPWQNGTAERVVGSARRELLDHVIVLNEDHPRWLLREYVDCDNAERAHTSIGES